jgi:hypothetical protein
MIMLRMERWVQRTGTLITFGNLVGGFSGDTYSYKFKSVAKAKKAEEYLKARDPEEPNLPTAFGPEEQKRFGATKIQ